MKNWTLLRGMFAAALLLMPAPAQAQWLDKLKDLGDAVGDAVEGAIDDATKGGTPQETPQASPSPQQAPANFNADKIMTKDVQSHLKRLGYPVSVDGVYGPGTRSAIVQFEQSRGLPATGNVTPMLVTRLQSTATPPQSAETPAAQQTAPAQAQASASDGNENPALVLRAQRELKRLGYEVSADGAYGPNTREAIESFEKSEGLTVTGDVSPELVSQLEAAQTAVVAQAAPEPTAQQAVSEPATMQESGAEIRRTDDGTGYFVTKPFGPHAFVIRSTPTQLTVRRERHGAPSYKVPPKSHLKTRFLIRFDDREIEFTRFKCGQACQSFTRVPSEDIERFYDKLESGGSFEFYAEGFWAGDEKRGWVEYDIAAAKTAAAAKAEAMAEAKSKAEAEAATKVAAAAPAPGAPLGPVGATCQNNHSASRYFDCACLDVRAPEFRDLAVTGPDPESQIKRQEQAIVSFEKSIKYNEDKNVKNKDMINAGIRKKIQDARERIAVLKNPSLITEVPPSDVFVVMINEGVCKATDSLAEEKKQGCAAGYGANKMSAAQLDRYCTCVGDKEVELWHDYKGQLSSKSMVSIATSARLACK